ncbi:cytochrome b/b6 domain-containing protein [Thalassotalea sp. M1531]|uniref:Cytochrome b/b6 domain-containing protein n=1 Tax=Thalassotalea algicola TaxID=2716224 RepID=A0A7Y0Q759_9GAMM|nr:cytochrome b/b6 domain-containing protein [Thalassotalea algicola]NMP31532.1 cytochrome b/b6 domain-containing protein [Thalassotalea algicola]
MDTERKQIYVWSRKIRFFHWLNVIAITLLVAIGVIILNSKTFGISTDGKILLKTLHVFVGYVFALNLFIRILFGFIGTTYEKWSKTLPFNKKFARELREFIQNKQPTYKGHNPLGKLMVLALMTLMLVQTVSGLVIAGTDIYYPPLGRYFAESVAIDKNKLEDVKPYSKVNIDESAYKAMREVRKPFITAHIYAFYGLIFLIPLHIFGVIIAERRERSALVSSMINGYKYLPVDTKD